MIPFLSTMLIVMFVGYIWLYLCYEESLETIQILEHEVRTANKMGKYWQKEYTLLNEAHTLNG